MAEEVAGFRCRCCGNCCRVPGYVLVSQQEIDRIAEFMGIDVYQFIETYTRLTNNRAGLSLIEKDDGACVFLGKDNRCLIEDVKPEQCRKFPSEWKYSDMRDICPGWQTFSTGSKRINERGRGFVCSQSCQVN